MSKMNTTSELAARQVGNQFDLVLIASRRIRELRHGSAPLIRPEINTMSTALKEIELGLVGREYLKKADPVVPRIRRK